MNRLHTPRAERGFCPVGADLCVCRKRSDAMPVARGYRRLSFTLITAFRCGLSAATIVCLVGIWQGGARLTEKGYYSAVLLLTLIAVFVGPESICRRAGGLMSCVTCSAMRAALFLIGIAPLCIGLFDASLTTIQRGFYAVSFALGILAAIAVHQTIRELHAWRPADKRNGADDPRG